MVSSRLRNLALAVLVGGGAALPAPVDADDTEIYLGDVSVSEGARPNVLFIMDTSGSMSAYDGQPEDRLDRMKEALHRILDEANNINVGLMRFTDPGGPVLFPVSYIDEDVSVVEAAGAGSDVRSQLGRSSGNEYSTDDLSAIVQSHGGSGQRRAYTYRGSSSQAPRLEVTYATTVETGDQIVGLRFQDVGVPQGATITSAVLELWPATTSSEPADVLIRGQADDDAPTFSAMAADIGARAQTTASIAWKTVPAWDDIEEAHQSPDLSAIDPNIGLPRDRTFWYPGGVY